MKINARIVRLDFKYNDVFSIEGYANSSVSEGIIASNGCNEFNIDLFWSGVPSNIKSLLTIVYANVAKQLEDDGLLVNEKVFATNIGNITLINPSYQNDSRIIEVELLAVSSYFQLTVAPNKTIRIDTTNLNLEELFKVMDNTFNNP